MLGYEALNFGGDIDVVLNHREAREKLLAHADRGLVELYQMLLDNVIVASDVGHTQITIPIRPEEASQMKGVGVVFCEFGYTFDFHADYSILAISWPATHV